MRFADYEFEHVCDIEPLRETDGSLRQHMPQERYKDARNLSLNRYGAGPFCKFRIPNRLQASGVYVLTVDGAPTVCGRMRQPVSQVQHRLWKHLAQELLQRWPGDELPFEQPAIFGDCGRAAYIAVVFPDRGLQGDGTCVTGHSEAEVESNIGFNLKCIPEGRMAGDRQFTLKIQQP